MQAAARPGAGSGASAPMVAMMTAHHRPRGSAATFQTAQVHDAGRSINGQVDSISHATPCSSGAPSGCAATANAEATSTAGTMTSV